MGSFAVQLAKAFGAQVTGVCHTRNADLVRSLGADHVIDYTRQDITHGGLRDDLIVDLAGNGQAGRRTGGEPLRGRARTAGIIAVVLAALAMGLTFAHTLELPQKMGYDAAMWTSVQHSLYRYFAVIGGPIEVAAVIAAVVFAVRARGLPARRLANVGAACFIAALAWCSRWSTPPTPRSAAGRSTPYRRTGSAGEPNGSTRQCRPAADG